MIVVRLKRLAHSQGLQIPSYQSEDAAGLDLAAAVPADVTLVIKSGERALIPTGFALELPKGFEGQIRPRSGLALSYGVTVLNSPGTIDSDYRGEIGVVLVNHGSNPFEIRRGARIAQLVIAPVERVLLEQHDQLSESDRGSGGYGSTGVVQKEIKGEME